MQILFRQNEIESAIQKQVSLLCPGSEVSSIAFTAGRGATGMTAEVDVVLQGEPLDAPEPVKATPTPKKPKAQESKPVAKEEDADADRPNDKQEEVAAANDTPSETATDCDATEEPAVAANSKKGLFS